MMLEHVLAYAAGEPDFAYVGSDAEPAHAGDPLAAVHASDLEDLIYFLDDADTAVRECAFQRLIAHALRQVSLAYDGADGSECNDNWEFNA